MTNTKENILKIIVLLCNHYQCFGALVHYSPIIVSKWNMHTVSKLTKSDISEKLVETEMDGTRLVLPAGEGFVFENILEPHE